MSVWKHSTKMNNAKRPKLANGNINSNFNSNTFNINNHQVIEDEDDPYKRDTALPTVNQQPGKNVVYLDMKNRSIKSDGAYSVSQVIKVNFNRNFKNFFIIFCKFCII